MSLITDNPLRYFPNHIPEQNSIFKITFKLKGLEPFKFKNVAGKKAYLISVIK